ncbi:MAG: CoA-binding protein [Flavobacteriales bacterium]
MQNDNSASGKTLVVGASENSDRYSFKAISILRLYNYPLVAIGLKPGKVADVNFITEKLPLHNIETVTLYIGLQNQLDYEDYLLQLKPVRVIFNPGTENPAFAEKLRKAGIEPIEACTLVMLSTGQY